MSVLLHDLVVRDRPATICGRERNPTWIESAIRARFVRDSFHSLNTGLRTGLPRHLAARAEPVPPRWATLGTAWKMRAVKDGTSAALPLSAPKSKTDRLLPRHDRRPGASPAGLLGHRAQCRLPRRTSEPTVMQALRLRQRGTGAQPPRSLARPRDERVAMGVCRASGKHVSSALRDARAAQSAAGTHWQEPNHAARSVIRDPC